jgi:hypothetical protein
LKPVRARRVAASLAFLVEARGLRFVVAFRFPGELAAFDAGETCGDDRQE